MTTDLIKNFWMQRQAWQPIEEYSMHEILPSKGGIALILSLSTLIGIHEGIMKRKSLREELRFLNTWSGDMIKALQDNPEILNPSNRTPCIQELFKTDCQKSYTGLHDALCSLPQSCAPLLVWFLLVFVKQMKIQRMKDSEVVMQEEADKENITRNSTVSYSTLAKYEIMCSHQSILRMFNSSGPLERNSKETVRGKRVCPNCMQALL